MNLFDLTRVLYATHFLLGIPFAIWGLPFLVFNPIVSAITDLDLSGSDALRNVSFGILLPLWYFVWCGSIMFAVYRRFPVLSIRLFSVVVASVYLGIAVFLLSQIENAFGRVIEYPLYPMAIGIMLLIAFCGMTVLPRLKIESDREEERILEQRDRRLNELYPPEN